MPFRNTELTGNKLLVVVVCAPVQLCPTLCNPVDCSQAPLPMGFPRQAYWSGFPCPPPSREVPSQGIEPASPALQVVSLPTEPPEKPVVSCIY